jgi:uncharacterized protein (DUF433 family)
MSTPEAMIVSDPKIMGGKPVVKGTRVPVETILRECANGLSHAEIAAAYPAVTEAQVKAAIAFAADYLAHETIIAAE